MTYQGKVNGIDIQVTENLEARCQAFVNNDFQNYIQLTTNIHSLQTALELACLKDILVEVTYNNNNSGLNILTRVRLLDR